MRPRIKEPHHQQSEQSICSFNRIARINSYVTVLFVTLYFLSCLRLTTVVPRITTTPSHLPVSNSTLTTTETSANIHIITKVETPKPDQSESESATAVSETYNTVSETEPTASETEPTASETEPTSSETEPTASETEPTASETEPTASETEPTASETEPTASETEPTSSETEPTSSETEPTASETEPTASETEPTSSETEPTASETTPSASETASSSENVPGSTQTLENETVKQNPETSTILPLLLADEDDIVCEIPELDPFDKSIKKFIEEDVKEYPPKCHEKYPQVFKLGLNFTILRESNTTEWKDCCYKEIYRSQEDTEDVDSDVVYSKDCTPMPETVTEIPAKIEFIGIYCKIPERQRKALEISSTESTERQLIDAFAFVPVNEEEPSSAENDSSDNLNVVILGIDGVSHMNFLRIMPEVHKFLMQNLSAISMDGYVKVGENTFPNLVAALAAMNASHVKQSCEKNEFFDDCPFLWKKFAAEGYKTSYGEDSAWMGAFNYLKNGFKKPPVDYYLRPVARVLEKKLGSDERLNAKICFGPRISIEVILNYMQKMALAMNQKKQRYFQFLWATSLTHDYLNLGKFGQDATLKTLKWFQKEGHLNKTLFVLMSDHGIRYGPFRKTRQGKIELNLPFLYFVFPEWFKQKYPSAIDNMKKNTKRLTTPFDLHETLLDLLSKTNLEESEINQRNEVLDSQRQENEVPRGISLFLPSPLERTCAMAHIPEHFCACHETEELESKSFLAHQAANFAVYEINSFISKYMECAFLNLHNITSAYMFNRTHITNVSTHEQVVKVSFVTSPGGAEFEGTVIRHLQNSRSPSWSLSDVSRVDLYRDDSYCINNKDMKKYCYCNDLLKR